MLVPKGSNTCSWMFPSGDYTTELSLMEPLSKQWIKYSLFYCVFFFIDKMFFLHSQTACFTQWRNVFGCRVIRCTNWCVSKESGSLCNYLALMRLDACYQVSLSWIAVLWDIGYSHLSQHFSHWEWKICSIHSPNCRIAMNRYGFVHLNKALVE